MSGADERARRLLREGLDGRTVVAMLPGLPREDVQRVYKAAKKLLGETRRPRWKVHLSYVFGGGYTRCGTYGERTDDPAEVTCLRCRSLEGLDL